MNGYVRLAHRLLGRWTSRRDLATLQRDLFRAHVDLRADAWLSAVWLSAGLAALWGALLGLLAALALPLPIPLRVAAPLLLAFLLAGWTLVLAPMGLRNRATEIAKLVDENLPHAINHLLALAGAGLTPRDLWGSLAKAQVFGPLAYEASRIRRDLDVFGDDLLTALRAAQERSASRHFEEFLQGAISAFQSGVDLENYLRSKGAHYRRQAVEEQLKTFDAMGVMAETFLVSVVAGPLFLIILLTVMSISQGRSVLLWGYLLVLVLIPVSQLTIGALIKGMSPRVYS